MARNPFGFGGFHTRDVSSEEQAEGTPPLAVDDGSNSLPANDELFTFPGDESPMVTHPYDLDSDADKWLPGEGNPIPPTTQSHAPPAAGQSQSEASLLRMERLMFLTMLTGANPPVTELAPPLLGSVIGSSPSYVDYVTNHQDREIVVQVVVEFVTPGAVIKLSLSADIADVGKIDTIGNSANMRTESVRIALKPQQTLFVASADTTQVLTVNDVIRARIFDPQVFMTPSR